MRKVIIAILFSLLLIGCRNYTKDRPLSPGMTTEEVRQSWGNGARKEFIVMEGRKIDFWYYNFGLSQRVYSVIFADEKLAGFYSRHIGPQHVIVHHTGSISIQKWGLN